MIGEQSLRGRTRLLSAAVAIVAAGVTLGAAPARAPVDYNTPTGTRGLIMVDKVGGFVRFFDPRTLEEIPGAAFDPSPDPGIKPHDLSISPDHRFAYVTVYGDGVFGNNPKPGRTIAVVDLNTRKMVAGIDVSPNRAPHGIQIDGAGKLYVTSEETRKVLIVDPAQRRIEATIDTGGASHWLALVPGRDKLYVTNKTDHTSVSVIDIKQRRMVGSVPMPNGTQGIVAAPDGSKVLVADNSASNLAVISPATDTVVDRIPIQGPAPGGMYKVFYSPDGKYVLTLKIGGQANILDASNLHGPQKVLQVGRAAMGFGFAPDGKTALVGNHNDGTASVIDLASGAITRTFPAGKGVETLQFY